MTIFRFIRALLIFISLLTVLAGQSLASTFVWILLDLPPSEPESGSNFTSDLKISSWNGVAGALDLTVHYDPAVLNITAFSPTPNSPFYPNCFTDQTSFISGETRIVCFQVATQQAWPTPVPVGILSWKVVGAAGSVTDITIEPTTVVDTRWSPVEVLAYVRHLTIQPVYLPIILRN